ncbi:hypothetical protein DPMN_070820 [Dreissena polymorpha]|uniref:Uncharacterized protein n=1 Tax=Dreissena polymorpha TaxID=45954 RepID=A0A9D3Z1P7_DREPO|nr:hypothetical protein DPMN_070820 [Dreissena polymorpha]
MKRHTGRQTDRQTSSLLYTPLNLVSGGIKTDRQTDRKRENESYNQAIQKTRGPRYKHPGHVYQRTGTTFELNQHIIKTNILTNFKLDRDFIGTKLLTKFHKDRTINVASRVRNRRRTKTGHKSSPEQSGELKRIKKGDNDVIQEVLQLKDKAAYTIHKMG